jgi:periplasmic protein TonB
MITKTILLFPFLLLLISPVSAQNDTTVQGRRTVLAADTNDVIYQVVEETASFPGGMDALMLFLKKNLEYPDVEASGTVYVQFVVEKDGTITNVSVRKGVVPKLDEAAVAVVRKMPKWIPGRQLQKPVRTILILPIEFKLEK